MTAEHLKQLEDNLWQAADKLRANSNLKASEYSAPVLGLIFLRFASIRYNKVKPLIKAELEAQKGKRLQQTEAQIAIAKCGFYLPLEAEYNYLLNLPEEADIAKAIKAAMEIIEEYRPELKDSLPKDEYFRLYQPEDRSLPKTLLKTFADIPDDATGDVFGKVYEYFLSEFALAEGQGGGEFFTPTSVVKLMVEVIEPYKGTILDPACGSGGMFVQSSYFVDRRREELHDTDTKDLMVYGADKTSGNANLAKLNLAINGLRGEIRTANAYYEDPFNSYERFDYVMANPPFNVDDVNLDKVKGQKRFNEFGVPQNKTKKAGKKKDDPSTVPNANYLWISLFATSLKPKGRAALVMANSASDARHSEADIRRNLIKSGVIDCMLTLPKNMFYTVTLPATLWFFDKAKSGTEPKVMFIDARNIFRQVTRALREFTDEQIQNMAAIVRLYRGETERFKTLIESYKEKAADYEKQAATVWPAVDAADTICLAAHEKWDSLRKEAEANKAVQTELARVTKELNTHCKKRDETKKAYKELIEKQRYYEQQAEWLTSRFPNCVYEDVTGLCKAATLKEIEEQDWSLNPGRYVGVVVEDDGLTEEEFQTFMRKNMKEYKSLTEKSQELENNLEKAFRALNIS